MTDLLVRGTPWLLAGLYAAWAAALLWNARKLLRLLREACPRGTLAAAALIAAGACALRLAPPPRHLVYADELEHADVAANLAERFAFAETLAGGLPEWSVLAPPIWPGGVHALAAPFTRLAAVPETAFFRLNAVLGGLTAGLAALAAAAMFRSAAAGLGAGLLLGLWPLHARLSSAGGLEIGSCFWLAACALALWAWREDPDKAVEALALATGALAAHARLENALLVPALFLAAAPRGLPPWRALWPARAAFLLACAAALSVAWVSAGLGRPGYAPATLNPLSQLARNLPGSLAFALSPASRLLPLAALAGLSLRASRTWGLLLLGWAGGLFFLYNSYALGDLSRGDSWRYAAAVGLPLCLAAGAGLSALWTRSRLAVAVILALCAWPGPALNEPAPGFESSWRLVKDNAARLPKDVPVIAFSPSLPRAAARKPAVSALLLLEEGPRARELWKALDARGAVLLEDEWTRRRPEQARALSELLDGRFARAPLAAVPGAALVRLTPLRPRGR